MKIHIQAFRYTLVGILSNSLLYALYLLLTYVGMGHKTSMSLLYILGIIQTFVFNKKWTFKHQGDISKTFIKYVTTYALIYVFQLLALILFVDKLGHPHQVVMGLLIIASAILIFAIQKWWVFSGVPETHSTINTKS